MSIREYPERIGRLGCLEIIPVDVSIWIRNLKLDWDHRDPADRTIVATALSLNQPLLTKDEAIRSFGKTEYIYP